MNTTWIARRSSLFFGFFLAIVLPPQPTMAQGAHRYRGYVETPMYFTVSAGAMKFSGADQTNGGGPGIAVGIGGGYQRSDRLALEFEVLSSSENYEAPPSSSSPFPWLVSTSDTMYLDSTSLFFNVKRIFPMRWFQPYIGVGIGINRSTLEVPAYLFGFIPGTTHDESETSLAGQLLLGADFILREKWALGLDFRRVEVQGDFDGLPQGTIEMGGDVIGLNLKHRFSF